MRNGADTAAGWRAAVLMALLLAAPWARAEAGSPGADGLCEQAERAERDARDFERKSAEREKFLKGRVGIAASGIGASGGAASGANTAAVTQALKGRIAEARAMLPQIRQGIAAASQDRGVVPGLSEYFSQLEGSIGSTLQSIEACLDRPESCSAPAPYCPAPPYIAVYSKNNASASFIRQVQDSYRQSANAAYQACRNLSVAASQDLERLRQQKQSAAMQQGAQGNAGGSGFGDADLYLKRAEALKREAAQHRARADALSGANGYCRGAGRSRPGANASQAAVDALKSAAGKSVGTGLSPGATVINLKAGWGGPWNKGRALGSDVPPLPKSESPPGDETTLHKIGDYLSEKGAWWWYKGKALYREADEQVELTEFVKSRPEDLATDAVGKFVEHTWGPIGKSATTGYKILKAVKSTSAEVGEILTDAPAVLARGSESDMKELGARSDRVPQKLMNDLFDDATGKFPPPRHKYSYKTAQGDAAAE